MLLVSNEENTRFRMRVLNTPDWQEVGTGKIVTVHVMADVHYEIAAKPPGYIEKMHTLSEPLKELRFTFMISEKEPERPSVAAESPRPPPEPGAGATAVPSGLLGSRWAVVIGISLYADHRIPPLRYAERDAQAFYTWLTSPSGGRYSPQNTRLLLGKEATSRQMKEALNVWLARALAEDLVTIYFAGHGTPDSPDSQQNLFLLPYDADYEKVAATAFPMWDVETALKRYIKARKVVVIADACHAGGIGASFAEARRGMGVVEAGPIAQGFQSLANVSDGVAVITSGGNRQLSQESERWGGGHGVFTHFLLKGLQGEADYTKDGRVTLGEMIPYLSQQVRRETSNAQAPEVAGKFDPALTLGQ